MLLALAWILSVFTVFFALLSRYHIGIMASVKDHYPVCRWISGMIVSFQPDKDVRKLVLIWNQIGITIFDLQRFIRYFEDSGCESNVWSLLTSWRKLHIGKSFVIIFGGIFSVCCSIPSLSIRC